jgi:hypothetical protein
VDGAGPARQPRAGNLVRDWWQAHQDAEAGQGGDAVILAYRRDEVDRLNTTCQQVTARNGRLGAEQQCTTSTRGRSVQIHPDEALLVELRTRQQTPQGRVKLRERVKVEHTWPMSAAGKAAVPATSADARTCSTWRRVAVVHSLHVIARQSPPAKQAA